jgi:hypothetical protein
MAEIYCIKNTVNGKLYIGQTVRDKKSRWNSHVCDAMSGRDSMPLHSAIRKYGKENFTLRTIATCGSENLDWLECVFIALYGTQNRDKGYNRTMGGDGLKNPSAEVRKKMADAKRGKQMNKWNESARAKLSASKTGVKTSEKHRAAVKAGWAARLANPNIAKRKHGEEAKAKMREAAKGRKPTAEAKEKMSAAKRGKKHSLQHRRNISEGLLRRKAQLSKSEIP